MKKLRTVLLLLICLLLIGCGEEKPAGDTAPNLKGEHYKSINVNLNCDRCEADKEVIIQLFADGYKVNDERHVLNRETGYEYRFEDLPMFKSNNKEIKYEVKIYENGNYRTIVENENSYRPKTIDKWVQVQYTDLEPGHTYVLVTDNWNYESSGSNPYKYLRGDVTLKSAYYNPEYNIINGKHSFYTIDGEPITNTDWILQTVPEDDPYYEEFGDYYYFVDEAGKKLTLTKYNRNGNYIFKYSGKDGYIESEDAYYNNKVSLIPIENSKGRFYIGSRVITSNTMRYLSISANAQVIAQTNIDDAAQFLAFEQVQGEVLDGSEVYLTMDLCDDDNDPILDGYKHINVKFNCDDCDPLKDKSVTIQLFADGVALTNRKKTLNKSTGYEYMFKNLPIFKEDEMTEIKYEVKILNDDNYQVIPDTDISNKKTTIKKWVQVLPENIEAGHTYVLITDNWNYENNGFSRKVYLRGDVTAKGAKYDLDYNIINGKKSYHVLTENPVENTNWTVSSVPTNDPNYEKFSDYLMFTNEEGKRLVLTGYDRGVINFMYKPSSKDGYVEDEHAQYTNKVKLYPIEGTKGRFHIGTMNLYEEPNNMTQYLSLDFNNQYRATSEIDNAAQFMAFEYVDVEVDNVKEVMITPKLCERNGAIIFTNLDKNTDAPLKSTLIELHDADNDELVSTAKTDNNGKVRFNNLRLGRYYIVEKDIQTGYVLSAEPVSFELNEEEPTANPLIKNPPIIGDLIVTDIDSDDTHPLKDALIDIYDASTNEVIKSLRTNELGKVTLEDLKYGSYYVIQKEPPVDYELNNERFDFTIDTDGKVVNITIKNKKIEKEEPKPDVPQTGATSNRQVALSIIVLLALVTMIVYLKTKYDV